MAASHQRAFRGTPLASKPRHQRQGPGLL